MHRAVISFRRRGHDEPRPLTALAPRDPEQPRRFVLDLLLVGLVVLAVLGTWSATDGGFAEVVWYPSAVLLLVLFAVLEWSVPARRLDGWTASALAGLAGLTVWSFLSISWAGDRGLALTGSNRTLLYLIVFALIARRVWRTTDAAAIASVWALTVVGTGLVELGRATGSGAGFIAGRFSAPIDYANANGALFALAAWPLVLAARSRAVPVLGRAVGLAGAGVAAELALLAQSKGAAIATGVTVVLIVAVMRSQVRTATPIVLVAAIVALFHAPLLNVYTRLKDPDTGTHSVRSALLAILASAACLFVLGAVVALVDRRLARSPRRAAALARVAAAVGVLAIAAGAAAAVHHFGSPVSVAKRTWHTFKYPPQRSSASTHFFSGAGNHRYDFWRVAAHQFESSPVLGKGVDNFGADYVLRRRSNEEPTYPHSLEARLLGGTGIVGFVLFFVFAIAAGWRCLAAARAPSELRSLVGATGLALLVYWLAHGSVDWLWEFPALSGPVVTGVAFAGALGGRPERTKRSAARLALRSVSVVAVLLALVALVPAWLAARDISVAAAAWHTNPGRAYSQLRQAARLNRLSDQPYGVAGTIAERLRDWRTARSYFASALTRNDRNWYSWFEEGIADARTGRRGRALAELRHAHRLDPGEPLVSEVLDDVRDGHAFSVAKIDQALVARGHVVASR